MCRRLQYSLWRRGGGYSRYSISSHSSTLTFTHTSQFSSFTQAQADTHTHTTDLQAVVIWSQYLGARKTCPADSKELGSRDCRSVETARVRLYWQKALDTAYWKHCLDVSLDRKFSRRYEVWEVWAFDRSHFTKTSALNTDSVSSSASGFYLIPSQKKFTAFKMNKVESSLRLSDLTDFPAFLLHTPAAKMIYFLTHSFSPLKRESGNICNGHRMLKVP